MLFHQSEREPELKEFVYHQQILGLGLGLGLGIAIHFNNW